VPEVRTALGRTIRKLRQLQGLTQEGLGERAGLSYKFVGEVERGQGNPTVASIEAIATALNVTVAMLFCRRRSAGRDRGAFAQGYLSFATPMTRSDRSCSGIGGWQKRKRRSRN